MPETTCTCEQAFATELALLAVDPTQLDATGRAGMLAASARLRAHLDARDAAIAAAAHTADDASTLGATTDTELLRRAGSISGHTARRRARTATALAALPDAHTALAGGAISFDHAAVLAALWQDLTPHTRSRLVEDHPALVDTATTCSPETFRRRLATWHRHVAEAEADTLAERRRQRTRTTSGTDEDGMGWLNATLTPEQFAIVSGVLDRLVDELWRAERAGALPDHAAPATVHDNAQRRADALVELARRAAGATAADARAAQPTMHVLIDLHTLTDGLHDHTRATFGDGTPISVSAARRLACDAHIIPHVLGAAGQPLDIGRTRRLATGAQRNALRVLHHGTCGIENCDVPFDYCDIHHITWWEHSGPTDLANLVPLCSRHHHFVHDLNWTLRRTHPHAFALDPPQLASVSAA